MKKLILSTFLIYNKKFPINRGKHFVGRLLVKLFGTMTGVSTNGLKLEIFPTSMMDLSYFDESNLSHKVTIDEINKLKEGDVFVDVGANIGYLSLTASKKVGKSGSVMAVEPSHREYKRLLNNIAMNKADNVVAYNTALGNAAGQITFSISPSHTGLNQIGTVEDKGVRKLIVPIFKFDDIYQSDKEIALLKIDVEGAEYQVLDGMHELLKKGTIKNIVVEITPHFLKSFGSSKEQLYELMQTYKYTPLFDCEEWQYDEVFKRIE